MFARPAVLAIAILASGSASASQQTHELISCGADRLNYVCYGVDGNTPVANVRRIQELYLAGWRLIDVEVQDSVVTYWLERPIAPEQ
jgi:hypothetical protein